MSCEDESTQLLPKGNFVRNDAKSCEEVKWTLLKAAPVEWNVVCAALDLLCQTEIYKFTRECISLFWKLLEHLQQLPKTKIGN